MKYNRVILIIIDACGVGELPDAKQYGDQGSATIPHIAQTVGGLKMPTCQSIGLGNTVDIIGVSPVKNPIGGYGKMAEKSPGKDSTTGHWEIGGVVLKKPFPTFPDGFPQKIVKEFEAKAKVKTMGNIAASGTEIIKQLGERHLKTKEIILYTSADSVFQLAAHEDIYPREKLYEICRIARQILTGDYAVARVIARPFIGSPGNFTRTPGRRDFSLEPLSPTVLDLLTQNNYKVLSIGKIYDLFAGHGISHKIKTTDNTEVMDTIIKTVKEDQTHSLIFANCVDFDMLWGHRNDEISFAHGLEEFDRRLSNLLPVLRENDLLIITADHGCDPTIKTSTDHTREYVPLLVYSKKMSGNINLGIRSSFTDIACTLADIFEIKHTFTGNSFYRELLK
ncbi:MAG: phosphopentomutase [FCB group bacterium]|nr:phosphopentomutase [FCB group bacterium]